MREGGLNPLDDPVGPRTQARIRNQRLLALDAARGIAMLFVCIAHFGWGYLEGAGYNHAAVIVTLAGEVATPTFIAISGILLGQLYGAGPSPKPTWPATRLKLIDRSIFLLTIGHALIVLAHQPTGFGRGVKVVFVTDVVAIAALAGAFLMPRFTERSRLALSLGLLLAGDLLAGWDGRQPVSLARELLGGTVGPHLLDYSFPFLQWTGVYLAATLVGQRLAKSHGTDSQHSVERRLLRFGASSMLLAILMKALFNIMRAAHEIPGGGTLALLSELTTPWQKLPPGPVFLLFQGGLGVVLVGCCMLGEHRPAARVLLVHFAVIGRNSLSVFIAQYALFKSMQALHLPPFAAWPLLFLAAIASLRAFAIWWDLHDGSRWLTVGLRAELRRRQSAVL
jgi:uncharacterized membrane protein